MGVQSKSAPLTQPATPFAASSTEGALPEAAIAQGTSVEAPVGVALEHLGSPVGDPWTPIPTPNSSQESSAVRDTSAKRNLPLGGAEGELRIGDRAASRALAEMSPTMPYNAHSWNDRRASEHSFKMSSSLWVDNALGFKTADDFAPFVGKETHKLEKRSWADLYVYKM
ncbi:MAG: hypothetical protein QM784_35355 [Polyangiaceae bacterium]